MEIAGYLTSLFIGLSLEMIGGGGSVLTVGFTGDILNHSIDWIKLLSITSLGITGTFAGNWLSGKMPGSKIKRISGWFILATGILILSIELFLK